MRPIDANSLKTKVCNPFEDHLTLRTTRKVISINPEIPCVEICLKEIIPKQENLRAKMLSII